MKYYSIIFIIYLTAIALTGCNKTQTASLCDNLPENSLRSVLECEINNIRKILHGDSISDPALFFAEIDSAANRIISCKKASVYGSQCIDTMIKIVYNEWGVMFEDSPDSIRALLPNTVTIYKKGSCLGTSLIFLLIAEKAGLDVSGVLLPGHFFVRYVNDSVSRNIEPNRSGYCHPDSYYVEKYGVENDSWYTLAGLSKAQTAGVFYFNLANIYRSRKNLKQAIRCYRKSTEFFPDYAEAWGNLAITYDMYGYVDSARSAFQKAGEIRPDLVGLKENIQAFQAKHGIK